MPRLGTAFAAAWLLGVTFGGAGSACDLAQAVAPPDGGTAQGGAVAHDGGADDAETDAAGGARPDLDAGVRPLRLGLVPNPRAAGDAGPTAGELLAAELATYAVGVRAVVLSRTWAELEGPALDELGREVAGYRAHQLAVVLNVLTVDRTVDHRPAALGGLAWNAPEAVAAAESLMDALLAEVGADLAALVLGRACDHYLAAHPGQASAFADLAEAAILHAEAFADGEPPAGVGLSFVGLSPSATYRRLLDLGELAVWSYQPGLGAVIVPSDTSATKDLDTMIELAGIRPIVLLATGTTTSGALGSSSETQQQFFDALFSALLPRRHHFAIVNVAELHDRGPAECNALATSLAVPTDSPVAAFLCASGLKSADGAAKPAWDTFIRGAAAFASP